MSELNNSKAAIPAAESLTVEFKSDRKRLSDDDLIQALVCLTNTEGGELWLGVEDDGTPTGLHQDHKNLKGLPGFIAAKTSPSLYVTVESIEVENIIVARIKVPKASSYEVATSSGMYLRRRLKQDGTPECIPLLPHERMSRASRLGLIDVSAQHVAGATLNDLDPLERERLRQAIQTYGGDRVLLELDDESLDGALRLTTRNEQGERVPTLAGLLIIGRETALREKVSTHEFTFQVLEREDVRFNEFRRYPLLKALEWLETNFRPFNPEKEVQVGLFRVPIPKVDMSAFREAVANALVHRDYHRLGAVYIRLEDYGLTISNPGGFVEGVTLHNLLTTEPRPRNPLLADAMKRIGVVERSGRGVDKIYRGMLRFGRPEPDYSRTDDYTVALQLATVDADEAFLQAVVKLESQSKGQLPIDSLIVLAALREQKRLNVEELAPLVQRGTTQTRAVLEKLVENGLIQPHGQGRGRTYTLSPEIYQAQGEELAYTRQAGLSPFRNEQMILAYVDHHRKIQRRDVIDLCHLNEDQATRLLKKLTEEGKLQKKGQSRATHYIFPEA